MKLNLAARKGILLEKVCGKYLLVATRMEHEYCPYGSLLNETAAYYWNVLCETQDVEEIVSRAAVHFNVPQELVRLDFLRFVECMKEQGYLYESGLE
ncbi:PqqD family protein [Bariatricus sp. SGI.154]|uniref:PqqD family protein n=1 Tax=Bariatricus sp. SGI.154 TaxID=3420549 RepID=UPI003CFE1C06